MARTTVAEVKAILVDTSVADAVIEAFIISAEEFITKVFEGDTTVSVTLLAEIERWLVAHMVASTFSRSTSKEKVGDAEVTYTGKFGVGLNSTPYGQMVLMLDFTGKLAQAGKAAATIYAVRGFN